MFLHQIAICSEATIISVEPTNQKNNQNIPNEIFFLKNCICLECLKNVSIKSWAYNIDVISCQCNKN